MPAILRMARKFRSDLLAMDDDALRLIAGYYRRIWKDLDARFDEISTKIEQERLAGNTVAWSADKSKHPYWLFQTNRYDQLLEQVERDMTQIGKYSVDLTKKQQERAWRMGEDHQLQMLGTQLGPVPEEVTRAGYSVRWNRVPTEAMQNLVGFLGDGSPLEYKFAGIPQGIATEAKSLITSGFAQGLGPREIARQVSKLGDDVMGNVLTTVRTETLRAYREASFQTYQANEDVMEGWIWAAAHQARTCAACWAMDGTFHKLSETLNDHVCGRCTMIPRTKSWQELYPELDLSHVPDTRPQPWNSETYFKQLTTKEQIQVLGPVKQRLWASGKLSLGDMVAWRRSDIWGDSISVASNRHLVQTGVISQDELSRAKFVPKPVSRGGANLLSREELQAIKDYTGDAYYEDLNYRLREGKKLSDVQQRIVKDLDSALTKLPAYEEVTHRIVNFRGQGEIEEFLDSHKGTLWVNYGQYLSTAKAGIPQPVGEDKVKLVVYGQKGRDISHLSVYPSEGEVLLPRTSMFTVRNMRYNEDGYAAIIEIEEV